MVATPDRLTPRMRGIPYAAASRFNHWRLWNRAISRFEFQTAVCYPRHPEVRALARLEGRRPACGRFILRGSLPLAPQDDGYDSAFPRREPRPGDAKSLAPLKPEGAGNAGCALHPRSRVPKIAHLAHTSIQGSGNTPTSPAQWLYGLYRALPGERAFLPPSLADKSTSLTPASRRQDHTTSPYASTFRPAQKRLTPKRPSQPRPTHRDDRETPLVWAGLAL